jgi:hypothetical protein
MNSSGSLHDAFAGVNGGRCNVDLAEITGTNDRRPALLSFVHEMLCLVFALISTFSNTASCTPSLSER